MNNEGAPEYFVDQGLYYPTPTNYGYYSTEFESPPKWDDQQTGFGSDAQDVQYAGAQAETFPFLYYTPSFGYGQSPFNPYNPYIPGAVVGVDGPFLGTPHYYTIPSYDNSSSSPAYFSVPPAYSTSDFTETNTADIFFDANSSTSNGANSPTFLKHKLSSTSSAFVPTHLGLPASSETKSLPRVSDGTGKGPVTGRQPTAHASVTSSVLSRSTSNQILQGGVSRTLDYVPRGKSFPIHSQLKAALQQSNGLSAFGSSMHGRHTADKLRSKFLYGKVLNDAKVCTDALEQNRGPRVDKPKNKLTLIAHTRTPGDADRLGNIVIYPDQYNKDDFQVDYTSAKFFVIKSYSEDDVHKSVKYGVWSSTPNGNKKLNNAYEDARRIANRDSGGCPIFLFFSVNASGQFCGVAEMTGPVDFHKDMDFWQQDKWSGSFPVKWHVIKDVPNPSFRHIILENNENKPVTNSRDTQEVRYRKGIEMLKVFKNYVPKTSLLDDFMYYENREKILPEEKARLVIRNYEYPFFVPVVEHKQITSFIDLPLKGGGETEKNKSPNSDKKVAASAEMFDLADNAKSAAANGSTGEVNAKSAAANGSTGEVSSDVVIKSIGTLTISSKQSESENVRAVVADSVSADVVTIGSLPVKVNGYADSSSGFLTFGTIDPGAFQQEQLGKDGK